jgi:hypothetical protein
MLNPKNFQNILHLSHVLKIQKIDIITSL